jgi:FHS family Na+ dependent glucose MFS transporter 1
MPTAVTSNEHAARSWKLAATGLYSTSFAALGLTFSILGPTLQTLASQTHSNLTDISLLFVARSIGSLVGSVGGGRLFDRFAGHRVAAVAMGVMIAATAFVPAASRLWMLTALLFISGMVHGTLNVGGNAMLIWVHGKSVAPFMNVLHFFFGAGTFLAPILVAQVVLLDGGMSWAYWLIALAFLPVTIAALVLPSPQSQHLSKMAGEDRADRWLVVGFFLIFFGYSGSSAAHGGWIFSYITQLNLASETTAAYINSFFWGALTAGRLLSIPLAVRFSPKSMLRMDLVGSLVSLGLMVVFPRSLWALALGSGGLGFFLATIFPTNMSLASRHIPITGGITGILSIGSSLGGLVLPWLVGQWFETIAPETLLVANLVNIGLTLVVFFWLTHRLKTHTER